MWVETLYKKDKNKQLILDDQGQPIITGYQYFERYFNKKYGEKRKTSVTLKSNSNQAKNKAIKLINTKIKKINSDTGQDVPKFKEAFEQYVNFKKPRWEKSTYINVTSNYKQHIEPYDINNYLITEITLLDVQQIVDKVQYDKELSERMARQTKNCFTAVFRYFKSYHQIDTVSLKDIEIEVDKKGPIVYIDSEDLPGVIDEIYGELNLMEAHLVETLILTGMRIGEATALTKDDVRDGKIIINKSIDSHNKRQVKDPKNEESIRIIESNQRLDDIFKQRIEFNDMVFGEYSNLIFANNNNRPPIIRKISDKLKRINPDYNNHTMRHTHISLLSENYFPLKYIMERVGHSNPETTLKIYTAVTEKQKNKAINRLDNLF